MSYYMVVQDKTIIDVLSDIVYVRTQIVHNKLMACSQKYAEGILSSDTNTIYYASDFIIENTKNYPVVTLITIDEEKYKSLSEILEINKTIDYESDDETNAESEPQEELSEEEQITIDFIRDSKINEMRNACHNKIISGFDVRLADGEMHHFDFTLEEQANIMFLKSAIDSGQTMIPYHASNEPCRFFSTDEIMAIIEIGTTMKTYEITYFNSLKQYILSLESIDDIRAVYYGMPIPQEYYSEVMAALVHENSNDN